VSESCLRAGPGQIFRTPSAAFAQAAPGDVIEIDAAGDYLGDVCVIRQHGLTIRGVNGRPRIDAAGTSAEGKAIWVIAGNDTIVDNMEFRRAAAPDRNGAGIRQEGRNLTVRNCLFQDNEEGILAAECPGSRILLEFSEFRNNASGDGYTHNIYIGRIAEFTMRFCHSHSIRRGHLVKSRAAINDLSHCRFADQAEGCAGYQIDFPNGGWASLTGNVIEKGALTPNPVMISFGEEGDAPEHPDSCLHAAGNTFLNHSGKDAIFVAIRSKLPTRTVIRENAFEGAGRFTVPADALFEKNRILPGRREARIRRGSHATLVFLE
jgi:hypothetical protein